MDKYNFATAASSGKRIFVRLLYTVLYMLLYTLLYTVIHVVLHSIARCVVHIAVHYTVLYTVCACCTQQVVVLQQQIQLQQNETDKLRSDNVKLYEKIKFLQGYPGSKVQCTNSVYVHGVFFHNLLKL